MPLIKDGSKTCTWRLWDDKELKTGDVVEFVKRPELEVFAIARLVNVITKRFADADEKDNEGHEKYPSNPYEVYSKYYNREVAPDTPLTVVHFEIERWA